MIAIVNKFTTNQSMAAPPSGWIEVPGNPAFSTSSFLVMKYEAKCATVGNLTTGLTTPTTSLSIYDNSVAPCTSANSKQVVSVASGYPIAKVSQAEVLKTYCSSINLNGTAAHLMTNNEWMTIARNIEVQPGNWVSGTVGSGLLYRGHQDKKPWKALVASTDDSQGYIGTGNSATSGADQKRTHTLSNGSVTWDLSGNVDEFINMTILGRNQPYSPDLGNGNGWAWREYNSITSWGPTINWTQFGPSNTSYTNATNGIGQIYSWNPAGIPSTPSGTLYAVARGGDFGDSSGIYMTGLVMKPGTRAAATGFRCVVPILP